MKKTDYLAVLEELCAKQASYFYEIKADDGPPIALIGFDDYPRPGDHTYFSYGLHRVKRPEWTHGRPEYFIVIDNKDRLFAAFFGYLLSAFAWQKVMGWNTLIGAGENDAVDGYPYRRLALGPPMYLGWESYFTEDDDLPIYWGMGYFISDLDFEAAAQAGSVYLDQKSKSDYNYWRRLVRRS